MTKVARTPSSFVPVASPEALDELELDRVLDGVAAHAVGPLGAAHVRARRPVPDPDAAREALALVGELARALRDEAGFSPEPVPDLSPTLEALDTRGSVLGTDALLALRKGLAAMRVVRQRLLALEDDAPRVTAMAVDVPPDALGRAIDRAVDDDGAIKDDASPELKRARRRVRETRVRLVGLLEKRLRDLAGDGLAKIGRAHV